MRRQSAALVRTHFRRIGTLIVLNAKGRSANSDRLGQRFASSAAAYRIRGA
jgi:hypothetical protein